MIDWNVIVRRFGLHVLVSHYMFIVLVAWVIDIWVNVNTFPFVISDQVCGKLRSKLAQSLDLGRSGLIPVLFKCVTDDFYDVRNAIGGSLSRICRCNQTSTFSAVI